VASECDFDAVILDVGLPDIDGSMSAVSSGQVTVDADPHAHAREAVPDRVRGLDAGRTTTSPSRLTSPAPGRVRALIRRGPGARPAVLTPGTWCSTRPARTVRRARRRSA